MSRKCPNLFYPLSEHTTIYDHTWESEKVLKVSAHEWLSIGLTIDNVRSATPFGQVPVLETDGMILCQSNTIGRFLAKRFGFAGKSELEEVRADMVVDCLEDIVAPLLEYIVYSGRISEIEQEKAKAAWDDKKKDLLSNLENLLISNKGGNGYFVGEGITWADMAMAIWTAYLPPKDFSPTDYPKLTALKYRVEAHPGIAAWIAKRPDYK